jgi:hypothetical protein
VIFFLYRQVVYTPDMPEDQRGVAELIIGKQRNGPIGTVPLTFLGQYTRFENYSGLHAVWSLADGGRRQPARIFDGRAR